MFRLLLLLIAAGAAFVWVEWDYDRERRSLTLRLRTGDELIEDVRDRSRELGRRVVGGASEKLAPVGAPGEPTSRAPGSARSVSEQISNDEQAQLDRLLAETTREQ